MNHKKTDKGPNKYIKHTKYVYIVTIVEATAEELYDEGEAAAATEQIEEQEIYEEFDEDNENKAPSIPR